MISWRAARPQSSIVMLKNDGMLPLSREHQDARRHRSDGR